MKTYFSGGAVDVEIGDQCEFDNCTWEVAKIVGNGMYSPSGIGGTAVYACKLIKGTPNYPPDYWNDGMVEFCGDSIASYLYYSKKKPLVVAATDPAAPKQEGR